MTKGVALGSEYLPTLFRGMLEVSDTVKPHFGISVLILLSRWVWQRMS